MIIRQNRSRSYSSILLYLIVLLTIANSKKVSPKKIETPIPDGTLHTFYLTKYEKPQQFSFEVSCKEPAIIDFELSDRLKRLHRYIFLNAQFQADECIDAIQDTTRINVKDEKWELQLHHVCCGGENVTKVFNETIKVIVRDGFKFLGLSITTKVWNIFIPIMTSLSICLFVWFSNFSQPRPNNIPFLARFYKDPKIEQNWLQQIERNNSKQKQKLKIQQNNGNQTKDNKVIKDKTKKN